MAARKNSDEADCTPAGVRSPYRESIKLPAQQIIHAGERAKSRREAAGCSDIVAWQTIETTMKAIVSRTARGERVVVIGTAQQRPDNNFPEIYVKSLSLRPAIYPIANYSRAAICGCRELQSRNGTSVNAEPEIRLSPLAAAEKRGLGGAGMGTAIQQEQAKSAQY